MEMSSSVATRLQYQHKALLDIIDDLSENDIKKKSDTNEWSIFETIVHLQTYQRVFQGRVNEIRNSNNPHFELYEHFDDSIFLENCKKLVREIMQDYITTRKEMAAQYLPLPLSELNKTGTHPKYGTLKLQLWMNHFLLHEAHHLYNIFKMAGEIRIDKGK